MRAGEIHALVGQNGCGKSTLIKVLAGYHQPDPGCEIQLEGRARSTCRDTTASRDAGFRFVHQDLGLVETLNTVENLDARARAGHRVRRADPLGRRAS